MIKGKFVATIEIDIRKTLADEYKVAFTEGEE